MERKCTGLQRDMKGPNSYLTCRVLRLLNPGRHRIGSLLSSVLYSYISSLIPSTMSSQYSFDVLDPGTGVNIFSSTCRQAHRNDTSTTHRSRRNGGQSDDTANITRNGTLPPVQSNRLLTRPQCDEHRPVFSSTLTQPGNCSSIHEELCQLVPTGLTTDTAVGGTARAVGDKDTNKQRLYRWGKMEQQQPPFRLAPLNTKRSHIDDHREREHVKASGNRASYKNTGFANESNTAVSCLPKIWEHSAKQLSKSYINLPQLFPRPETVVH